MCTKIILLLKLLSLTHAANILAIWPVVSRTHFTIGLSLFDQLAERGHTITLISPFVQKEANANIKMIKLVGAIEAEMIRYKMTFLELKNASAIEVLKENMESGRAMVEYVLENEDMKKVITSGEKFDLFMYDVYYNDALLGIPFYLNIPVIAFSSIGMNQLTNEMVKNPLNPAYNPSALLGFSDKMSFTERLRNTAVSLAELYHYYFNYLPYQNSLLKKHFGDIVGGNLPPLIDLIHNVNLVFHNTHPIMQPARALTQNNIEIGGMHLRAQLDEIHPDLSSLMDRAKYGIIYFSLGGNFRSSDLPQEKLDIFINVFTSLKQKDIVVLWKFETIDLKERHAHNLIIGPWMPQQEILRHKNLKAFITHGGLLSLMEAVHYGKPVIGIPIFNDQKFNMAQASSQGYGIKLDYDNVSEDMLRTAIDAIFNDTSYRESAERMSEHFKDNPIMAIDKAAWYVEHVIKTNGAKHLQTAATKLSFWEIHLIDQILFVSTLIIAVIIALSRFIKLVREKFQKRSKSSIKGRVAASVRRNKFKSN